MAIYLPKQHLIIDVVDDPCRDEVDISAFPDMRVVPLTCAELAQLDGRAGNSPECEATARQRALAPACWPAGASGGDAA